MFVNLKIKNIGGIKEEIDMNFISKSRNKETLESCIKTEDDIYINKQIVFIGSNSSGKTSILKAISEIGNFICAVIYRKKFLETIENKDYIGDIRRFLTQMSVIKQNINCKEETSYFEADMYIKGKDDNTTGYYKYELEFDKDIEIKGALKEILTYRKTYRSKKEKIIINKQGIKESQVGYIWLYGNNMDIDKDIFEYVNMFVNHYTKFSTFIQADSFEFEMDMPIIDWINKNPKDVINLVKIFDKNITEVEIKKDIKTHRQIAFFITETGDKLQYDELSNGTRKMLVVIYKIIQTVKSNGVCLIDEIEMGLYKELVNFILKIFYIEKNYSQLIFTSNYPEIIDEKFKYDQIFCLTKEYDTTKVTKLMDYKFDGKKVRVDMNLSKAYKGGKITLHPSEEKIDEFIKYITKEFKN